MIVKICGITDVEETEYLNENKCRHGWHGFIFSKK